MSEQPQVLYQQDGPVATLTFNRPETRNAMTWQMYETLFETCEKVDQDPSVRVLVITGAGGKSFAAGTDINQFRSFVEPQNAIDYEARIDRVVGRLARVGKPVIAQIQGFCIGGGLAMAMACDLRYCTPESRFAIPSGRLSNCLSMRNYRTMVQLVGPMRAREMMFTARQVPAPEALQIGLVTEVVAAEQLAARVQEVCTSIVNNAPRTLWASKLAINRVLEASAPTDDGHDLILGCYMSEDFKEGVDAFLTKRTPQWKGR